MEDIIERLKARDEADKRQVAAYKEKADADAIVAADMRRPLWKHFRKPKNGTGNKK